MEMDVQVLMNNQSIQLVFQDLMPKVLNRPEQNKFFKLQINKEKFFNILHA